MVPPPRARAWETIAVAGAAALAYAPSVPGGFLHWDDARYVVHNPFVQHPSLEGLGRLFTEPYYANYHPLHVASYALDHGLFGGAAWGFHLLNVLLFAVAAALAAAFLRRAFPDARWTLFAALVFAIHPVHVESVAWISARKDVLCVLFGMAYAYAHVRVIGAEGRRRFGWLAVELGCFALALLSKSLVAPLPVMLFAYDRLIAKRRWSGTLASALPALALAAGALFVAYHAQAGEGAVHGYPGGSLASGLLTSATVVARYLGLLVAPYGLSALYEVAPQLSPLEPAVLGALALLLALFAAAVVAWRRGQPIPLFALCWFGISLGPVSGIVPLSHLMADRYLLFGVLGFAVALAWGLDLLRARGRTARIAALALGGAFLAFATATSAVRSLDWHDDLRLWSDTVEKAPGDPVAHLNLGAALADARRYRDATLAFARALALRPETQEARRNLLRTARALEQSGDLDGAAQARRLAAARR